MSAVYMSLLQFEPSEEQSLKTEVKRIIYEEYSKDKAKANIIFSAKQPNSNLQLFKLETSSSLETCTHCNWVTVILHYN